jgi:endonuclease G, mitochondrial
MTFKFLFLLPFLLGLTFFFNVSSLLIFNSPLKQVHSDTLVDFSKNYLPAIHHNDEIIEHTAYTLCYSEEYEQAKWVAYRLTAEMATKKVEDRTNNFQEDGDVKTGSALPDDYKNSGFDRGHLCPAGDMRWSSKTMNESFYMSNMSPQLPKFNRGIWKNLESNVHKWAKKNKEIYIVTAGVLKGKLETIGENKVSVPHYFYKVVLDYHYPEYKAIAFVLPNEGSKKSIFNFAVSIDSVEHLTGIDFFPALPDSIENNLEARVDTLQWK